MIVAVVCIPSLADVIPVVPAEMPVTKPDDDTVAIDVLELDQLIVRPGR